ncbi:MAG: Mini-ribonuclease 3 [Acutalibacteraceae bacterium]
MGILFEKDCDTKQLSPLSLAFVGDTVFDLFVREMLLCDANRPVKKLHNSAAKLVNAKSQAKIAEALTEKFTEQEMDVFKRGRNAHTNHIAKNASNRDYHYATGLEAVFGFVYLNGDTDRLRELFSYAIDAIENPEGK